MTLYGISAFSVFPRNSLSEEMSTIAFPIVHCEADYFEPIYLGDKLQLELFAKKIDMCSFSLKVEFFREESKVACGFVRHVAINPITRKRTTLNKPIDLWLEASSLSLGVTPL